VKTLPAIAKHNPVLKGLSFVEVQALQKHCAELEEIIEQVTNLGHNDRYRRLTRLELMMEILDDYMGGGEEEEEEEEEES